MKGLSGGSACIHHPRRRIRKAKHEAVPLLEEDVQCQRSDTYGSTKPAPRMLHQPQQPRPRPGAGFRLPRLTVGYKGPSTDGVCLPIASSPSPAPTHPIHGAVPLVGLRRVDDVQVAGHRHPGVLQALDVGHQHQQAGDQVDHHADLWVKGCGLAAQAGVSMRGHEHQQAGDQVDHHADLWVKGCGLAAQAGVSMRGHEHQQAGDQVDHHADLWVKGCGLAAQAGVSMRGHEHQQAGDQVDHHADLWVKGCGLAAQAGVSMRGHEHQQAGDQVDHHADLCISGAWVSGMVLVSGAGVG